jgi:4-alpha-glucanotransferase
VREDDVNEKPNDKAWTARSAGVLLHVTSLPQGCTWPDADRFADLAAAAGLGVWQILPVGPVDSQGSPYQPSSAFAGNDALFAQGARPDDAVFARYRDDNADWLADYALFVALDREFGGVAWNRWPEPLREREPTALREAARRHRSLVRRVARAQCAFDLRWAAFKRGLNDRGIRLFGDAPLFLGHHSADVWTHRELFEIDADGACAASMGVPPDAYAADGQWWGFPPYRWDAMAKQDFAWWRRRFEVQARRFDLVRLDHFRGFAAYWRIPRGAKAGEGEWITGPGRAALDAITPVLHGAQLVAEDLGHITPDVIALRESLGIPGMRVLQFGFDGDLQNLHLPHRHAPDSVCYTGTHDNPTTLGWWRSLDDDARAYVARCMGQDDPPMPQGLVDWAWSSPAPLSIVPLQDLLGLDDAARMNVPGTESGNWRWRFSWDQVSDDFAVRLRESLARNGRV